MFLVETPRAKIEIEEEPTLHGHKAKIAKSNERIAAV
jgi:hypothetical protein